MGWELFGWSFGILRRNKRLLLFPIASGICVLVALFLCWLGRPEQSGTVHSVTMGDLAWFAPTCFLVSFLVLFFNCALAACAQAEFSGRETTVGYGLNQAAGRLLAILGWALLSTTVGLALRALERRTGRLASWIFGFAWGMATYLVVPVLVAEDLGPVASVRRSAQLLRDTWGDQLVAQIRFGWRGVVLFLPVLVLGALGANGYPVLLPVAAAVFLLGMIVLSAARGIFQAALYRFAATGEPPAGWTPDLLPGLFPRRA